MGTLALRGKRNPNALNSRMRRLCLISIPFWIITSAFLALKHYGK
jgi:hypothetical protein